MVKSAFGIAEYTVLKIEDMPIMARKFSNKVPLYHLSGRKNSVLKEIPGNLVKFEEI